MRQLGLFMANGCLEKGLRMMSKLLNLLLLVLLVAPSRVGLAETLIVLNASFEDPAIADGDWITEATPDHGWDLGFYDVTNPAEWMAGTDGGIWNPDVGIGYPNGSTPDGENAAYAETNAGVDVGLSQVLEDTLRANTQYDLSVQIGNPIYNESDTTADYRIELLAGGALLGSATGNSPTAGVWEAQTLTVTSSSNPAQLGQPLEIRLFAVEYVDEAGGGGYEVDFDEVVLTATPLVPVQLSIAASGADLSFSWNSQGERLYDLLGAADLATPVSEWNVLETGLVATPPVNSVTVSRPRDLASFYIVSERDLPPPFLADFEDGADDWTVGLIDNFVDTGTTWELGTPSAGPGTAHGGSKAWGTDLDADYAPSTGIFLRSPIVDLSNLTIATLEVWHYVDATQEEEGGRINIRSADGTLIEESFGSIFWGETSEWTLFSKRLPPSVLGKEIILEFQFLSEGNDKVGSGWYIDDVAIRR